TPPPDVFVSAPPAPPAATATATPVATPRRIDTKLVKAKTSRPRRTATFTFKAVGSPTRFECSLAKKGKTAKSKRCKSAVTYRRLKSGSYTFQVRAVGDS